MRLQSEGKVLYTYTSVYRTVNRRDQRKHVDIRDSSDHSIDDSDSVTGVSVVSGPHSTDDSTCVMTRVVSPVVCR